MHPEKTTLSPGPHGFHLTFPNGFVLSVQYGIGNYCQNQDYSSPIRNWDDHKALGTTKSFECAIMDKDGNFCVLPNDVAGHVPIGNLASIMQAVEAHDWDGVCLLCNELDGDESKYPAKQEDGSWLYTIKPADEPMSTSADSGYLDYV